MSTPKLRIAFLGDSITVGDGDALACGWPSRLLADTAPQPGRAHCYNLGVGGDRISDVQARCEAELAGRLTGKAGTGVALMTGVNDALKAAATSSFLYLEPDQISLRVRKIVQAAKLFGPVIVIEPTPVLPSLIREDGGRGDRVLELLQTINDLTQNACRAENVPLVKLTNDLINDEVFGASLCAGDGLHPTAEGYGRIASLIGQTQHWKEFLGRCHQRSATT